MTAAVTGKILLPSSRHQRVHGPRVLPLLPLQAVPEDQRVPISLLSAQPTLRRNIKTVGGEVRERRRWRWPHLLARRRPREIANEEPIPSKRMNVVGRRLPSRTEGHRTRTPPSKSIILNVMSPLGPRALLVLDRKVDLHSHRQQTPYPRHLLVLSMRIMMRA